MHDCVDASQRHRGRGPAARAYAYPHRGGRSRCKVNDDAFIAMQARKCQRFATAYFIRLLFALLPVSKCNTQRTMARHRAASCSRWPIRLTAFIGSRAWWRFTFTTTKVTLSACTVELRRRELKKSATGIVVKYVTWYLCIALRTAFHYNVYRWCM